MNKFVKWIIYLFILLLILLLHNGIILAGDKSHSKLVSTEWLASHLNDPDLAIIHVGRMEGYKSGHISGAVLLSSQKLYRNIPGGLSHQVPDLEDLKQMMVNLGVTGSTRIVLYFEDVRFASSTARAYLTLAWLGLGNRVSLLDGGLPNWRAEKGSISSEIKKPPPGHIKPELKENLLVDKKWLKNNLTDPKVVIIDSRPEPAYTGAYKDLRFKRHGHISSSYNLPFFTLLESKLPFTFKNKKELQGMFENLGIKPDSIVVTYCDTGVWSSLVWFAAAYLGYDARFYDGSFQEWSQDTTLPVIGQAKVKLDP